MTFVIPLRFALPYGDPCRSLKFPSLPLSAFCAMDRNNR